MLKRIVKNLILRSGHILIKKEALISDKIIKSSGTWDYEGDTKYWIGGYFKVDNFSNGYHGILQQWWEFYGKNHDDVLLISENNKVKSIFASHYPNKSFQTLDYYDNLGEEVDLKYNLCDPNLSNHEKKFGVIICQATLEHVYDPWSALKNMLELLTSNGVLIIHTHVPGYYYHPYPRDYLRYHPDWFIDAEKFIPNITLKELFVKNHHIFSVYQKN
ncbi:methyltransferase domain-containing protein [Thiothrix unzii]|jgi:SAM-dependent methyltransferase|uniref:class I SAM-dependent methyltransferase n=1 Tax=Thiothrix unzii TaxID=111769 RepID=UPI002A366B81|nr:methyltransferase domain-containing protein [Thiothrix unzii]MDX9988229.1 methyltransferase domain-containing protein [Thiothrix unzii]